MNVSALSRLRGRFPLSVVGLVAAMTAMLAMAAAPAFAHEQKGMFYKIPSYKTGFGRGMVLNDFYSNAGDAGGTVRGCLRNAGSPKLYLKYRLGAGGVFRRLTPDVREHPAFVCADKFKKSIFYATGFTLQMCQDRALRPDPCGAERDIDVLDSGIAIGYS